VEQQSQVMVAPAGWTLGWFFANGEDGASSSSVCSPTREQRGAVSFHLSEGMYAEDGLVCVTRPFLFGAVRESDEADHRRGAGIAEVKN
jgi:hypothetical protein